MTHPSLIRAINTKSDPLPYTTGWLSHSTMHLLHEKPANILLSPKQEWQVIDDEATSVGGPVLQAGPLKAFADVVEH